MIDLELNLEVEYHYNALILTTNTGKDVASEKGAW